MQIKKMLRYRIAAFAGIATQIFWGIIQMMIFQAFYKQTSHPEPISLEQAISFIWIGQALLHLLPWTVDKEIEKQVRSGQVAFELLRPVSVYGLWYVKSLAIRLIPTAMRSLPIFIVGGYFFGLMPPQSWQAAIAFGLSVCLALFLSAAITTLVIISFFWTLSGEGIQRLMPAFAVLLSGLIVPLPLFPNWLQAFVNVQPFRGIFDIPCRLYTGVIPPEAAFYYLGFQLAWTVFLILLGKQLLEKALKQFVIQGG